VTYPFRFEILAEHDRTDFDCGVAPLNEYFLKRVRQDVGRRFAACFVALDTKSDVVAGYYTVSSSSVPRLELPEQTTKKLPRYPSVPVVRIGRLAVDLQYQGKKLGSLLLFDAMKRTLNSEIATYAVVVDAKDDRAVEFYQHHGFLSLTNDRMVLFLPLSDAIRKMAE
jgi:ribosomal protein S18 acetylase RimI-like enzyme